jgi:hypothetical protein
MDPSPASDDAPAPPSRNTRTLVPAALASAGAGVIHAAAVGIHTEHVGLTRLFIAIAVAQVGAALFALLRPSGRAGASMLVGVNIAAFTGWLYTRFGGVSFITGLEQAERAQLADTIAAFLAVAAAVGAGSVLGRGSRVAARIPVAGVAIVVGLLTVPAMVSATSHQHDHGSDPAHGDVSANGTDHPHDGQIESLVAVDEQGHDDHPHEDGHHDGDEHHGDEEHHDEEHHGEEHHGEEPDAGENGQGNGGEHAHAADQVGLAVAAWPRPWDPDQPFDFSGVADVTPAQQARAERLVIDTLGILPRFADVTTVGELGYLSIGDSGTGFEHFINRPLINDDVWLDPSAPESLVYRVDGDERVLVSAMFIAGGRAMDDPELVDFGGPLMEWHVHDNLCWGLDENGDAVVKAVTDNHGGTCPPGTVLAGGDAPMVHVWITPHLCGPFAALEGHGAGQTIADGSTRADQCSHDHGAGGHDDDHQDMPPPS